jgi:hypothetical protein
MNDRVCTYMSTPSNMNMNSRSRFFTAMGIQSSMREQTQIYDDEDLFQQFLELNKLQDSCTENNMLTIIAKQKCYMSSKIKDFDARIKKWISENYNGIRY